MVVVVGWWQSIVLCQCWWTGIQGIPALFEGGGSICQSILVCQVLSTSSSGIYAIVPGGRKGGGPSAEVYLSAKFCLLVVSTYVLLFLGVGVHLPKYTCQPSFI